MRGRRKLETYCYHCRRKVPPFTGSSCLECAREKHAEANRESQRKRRQQETQNRREKAGLLRRSAVGWVRCDIACARCGEPFRPERSSGRYCSTRCRVAAHRAARRDAEVD